MTSSSHVGRLSFYTQNLDAGYSAPGQAAIKDTRFYGGTFKMPVTSQLSLTAKGDQRIEDQGLETRAIELNVGYKLTERWSVSTGVRNDFRKDRSPVVPLTQEQGERTDAVAQLMFTPGASWRAYGFGQKTVASRGGRPDNGRVGVGGSYRLTERFRIDAEGSHGDLGVGGKIGTSYLYSERTSLYLNYALENERTDNGQQARQGNLVSGAKTRLSDSSSVYFEERYQDGACRSPVSRMQPESTSYQESAGISVQTGEFGTLRDSLSGANTERRATGINWVTASTTVVECGRVSAGYRRTTRHDTNKKDGVAVPQQLPSSH
jgi:hypothetical protein